MSDETARDGLEALSLIDQILTGVNSTSPRPGPRFSDPYPPSKNPGQVLTFQPTNKTERDSLKGHTTPEDSADDKEG